MESSALVALAAAAVAFVGVALLARLARRQPVTEPTTDEEALAERNADAYKLTTWLFIGNLFAPMPAYYVFGVDDNAPWPAVTALMLSILLPLTYHLWRRRSGGPDFEEFLRYCELKDQWPRTWQIAVMGLWVLFAAGMSVGLLVF